MANVQDISYTIGEDWFFTGTVCDANGAPVTLPGDAVIEFRAASTTARIVLCTVGSGITILDQSQTALLGSYQVDISPSAQASIVPGAYVYEVWVSVAGLGDSIQNSGKLTVSGSLKETYP